MYDVIVIGLGGMGSAIAYHLARRGRQVLGLDRFTPPHGFGSSHGRSRIIRKAYYEDPVYVPLVLRAYELWRALEQDFGETLLVQTGGLMIGRPESRLVAGTLASAQQHGLPCQVLSAEDMRRRFPAFRLGSDQVAVHEEAAAVLFPERCVEAHLRLGRRAGAELRFDEPVETWEAGASSVSVRTASGRYEAQRLVLAAGPWNPDLLGPELPLVVERKVSFWFRPAAQPEWFEEGFPVFLWELDDGRMLYGLPGLQGEGVKVAFHYGGETGHPDRLPRDVRPDEVEALREVLRHRLPGLDGEPLRAATCLYTNTPDRHFVLGVHPAHPAVVVAGGGSGHAFKFCPAIGEAVADLVEGKKRPDLAPFDPRRLSKRRRVAIPEAQYPVPPHAGGVSR